MAAGAPFRDSVRGVLTPARLLYRLVIYLPFEGQDDQPTDKVSPKNHVWSTLRESGVVTTVGELFHSHILNRDAVIDTIERIDPNLKTPHCRHNHQRAWAAIQAIRNTTATDIVCELSVGISIVHEPNKALLSVLGRPPDSDERESKERDDLAFMPWSEWMSMQVDVLPECGNPPQIEILAYILCEMTLYGYSEDEIERVIADLEASNLPPTKH